MLRKRLATLYHTCIVFRCYRIAFGDSMFDGTSADAMKNTADGTSIDSNRLKNRTSPRCPPVSFRSLPSSSAIKIIVSDKQPQGLRIHHVVPHRLVPRLRFLVVRLFDCAVADGLARLTHGIFEGNVPSQVERPVTHSYLLGTATNPCKSMGRRKPILRARVDSFRKTSYS